MTSIFLAREFEARVWSVDLWIDPDNSWRRIVAAGCAERICPLRAEAHALPFAEGFFDVVVSVDAYQYFGTDVLAMAGSLEALQQGDGRGSRHPDRWLAALGRLRASAGTIGKEFVPIGRRSTRT
jgi:cyclopropane fatty-acyl-phospholipid synthase-like methyltransferase